MSVPITIAALKDGDEVVFTEIYNEYNKKVYSYILSKTNSFFVAEETTQLTFIKLWQYRANLNEELSISPQIFRIAKTTLIDLIRSQNSQSKALKVVKDTNDNKTSDIADQLSAKQHNELLIYEIDQMPTIRKKVFKLSRFEGLTYKEISETLSISVKAVEKQISRALKQLKHLAPFLFLGIQILSKFFL